MITFSMVINSDNDTVTITENILLGEKDIAKGISIVSHTHYKNQLFWDTEYTIGADSEPKTEYRFYHTEQSETRNAPNYYFQLNTDLRYGCDFNTPAELQYGLSRVYKEIYDKCEIGKEVNETIYLKDVYEYYPLRLEVYLPNVYWSGNDYENLFNDEPGEEKYVTDKFIDFFKIPVFEDHKIDIGISRDLNGGIGIHSGTANGSDEYNYFFYSSSTHTDDTVFFTIRNKTRGGQYADFSLVPGGYGIYSFKYYDSALLYETGIDADSLANVYPLDKEFQVEQMEISQNGKHLILIGIKDRDTILDVIDIETMTLVKEIVIENKTAYNFKFYEEPLIRAASGDYTHIRNNIKSEQNFIILIFAEDFALVETSDDGNYTLEFIAPQMNYVNDEYNFMDYSSKMLYDGDRFIIIDSLYSDELQTELCGYYVAIYNQTGLVYYAEYESSLDMNSRSNWFQYNCRTTNEGYSIFISE